MANKVSLIIPAAGHAEYLAESIESCLSQELPSSLEMEIIVMCDHDDDCFKIASKYTNQGVVVGNLSRHRGTYVAQNSALQLCTGRHVTFCGADDTIPPHRIARLFRLMRRHGPMTLANSYHKTMDVNGSITGKSLESLGGVFMYSMELFGILGGFRDWTCAADTEFVYRAKNAGANIRVVKSYDYNYRRHGSQLTEGSSTNNKSKLRQGYLEQIDRMVGSEFVDPVVEEFELALP